MPRRTKIIATEEPPSRRRPLVPVPMSRRRLVPVLSCKSVWLSVCAAVADSKIGASSFVPATEHDFKRDTTTQSENDVLHVLLQNEKKTQKGVPEPKNGYGP